MPRQSKETQHLFRSNDIRRDSRRDNWQYSLPLETSIKDAIRKLITSYVNADTTGEPEWTRMPEIPTADELGGFEDGQIMTDPQEVPISKINSQYASKEEYLETQYKLMRFDGILPLRQGIQDHRKLKSNTETDDYRIYDEVHVIGLTVANQGLALNIEFSGLNLGRIINWSKSKRLRTGSLVALTPANDGFKTKCVPAIVASRLLKNLEVKAPLKPSIQIYIGDSSQIEIDPQQKWIMMECSQGYWEAYRHTLKALQKVRIESFPLQEHFVNCKAGVDSPAYRIQNPVMNVGDAAHSGSEKLEALNVLNEWPLFQEVGAPQKDPNAIASALDPSQILALERMLTKRLAIVQGPPGTGKTFTSVSALKMILKNSPQSDPPIIIAAQTNHAIDQILRQIAAFEPEFVRLGGQTTDVDIIKPRTLHELKADKKPQSSSNTRDAANLRTDIGKILEKLLVPLQLDEPITADIFYREGFLTLKQRDSLNNRESRWNHETDASKMNLWCEECLMEVVNQDIEDPYASQFKEELENLDEVELEAPDNDDDKFEYLNGRSFDISPGFKSSGRPSGLDDKEIADLLSKHQDMDDILTIYRSEVYDYLRRQLTKKIDVAIQEEGRRCMKAAKTGKIGKWEADYEHISSARVIGLTTTGLSKYRGLLSALKPKIVLIEEAAETLEPYTVAGAFDTLEHMILVGDHQQLRANCSYPGLIGAPCNFDVSLFERLVKNGVEYTTLLTQRRMRPEIRELISHIYPDLTDHSSVMERPPVPGLEGNNVWFFHHKNEESTDETKSKKNDFEAGMIVEFAKYLTWNNISLKTITVLTFYNGQKKLIQDKFRKHKTFQGYRVKICTVDSYQGEENDVILLSLVRNNERDNIGFLSSVNRACVALSRARNGFYIFGNARLLLVSDHWHSVITKLRENGTMGIFLPIFCPIHNKQVDAETVADLEQLQGGCDLNCSKQWECGHVCPGKCHPGHICTQAECDEPCTETLQCGHRCSGLCSEECRCQTCIEEQQRIARFAFENGQDDIPPHIRQLNQGSSPLGSPVARRAGNSTAVSFQDLPKADPTPAEMAADIGRWTQFVDENKRSSPEKGSGSHVTPQQGTGNATLQQGTGNAVTPPGPRLDAHGWMIEDPEDIPWWARKPQQQSAPVATDSRSLVQMVERTSISRPTAAQPARQIRNSTITYKQVPQPARHDRNSTLTRQQAPQSHHQAGPSTLNCQKAPQPARQPRPGMLIDHPDAPQQPYSQLRPSTLIIPAPPPSARLIRNGLLIDHEDEAPQSPQTPSQNRPSTLIHEEGSLPDGSLI